MIEELDRIVDALSQRYYGKYRAEVTSNEDTTTRGMVQVRCSAILGEELLWAMPCVPYAGDQLGLFALPPVGASVWIEFEGGEINQPIWTGCFWKEGELPQEDAKEAITFLRTPSATIRIDNDEGLIEIEASNGGKITINADGITLEGGEVTSEANGGSTKVSASGFDAMNGAFTVS